MSTNKSEFYATRELFISYTEYDTPLSFDEWLALADDLKAAVLYCQFFEQITLAWYKLKSVYSSEADGVAEALQYLQKNVEIIKADEKRFTPSYIYKIMYNCLYCLCRDPNRYKKAYENEVSNIVLTSDGELDLFDTCVDKSSSVESYLDPVYLEKFWSKIEAKGRKAVVVVAELLGEEYDWTDANPDVRHIDEEWKMCWKKHRCTFDAKKYNELLERSRYADNQEGAVRIISDNTSDEKHVVEYEEYEKYNYKGVKKFSKKDHTSISEEERAEIMDFLRDLFGDYEKAYAVA